ncbi:MAG TPA: phospho-N-acetylmuramoyl-pentapeptide-transferase [Planctomycetota bacterium]|nr:phospho-N-acetylmuramoyl-pentapeptide-transferase [Planctomycetota bacterium]
MELFPEGIFRAITHRAAFAAVLAFLGSMFLMPAFLAWLKRRRIGERVEKGDAPQLDQALRSKANTPTMGGLFIVVSVVAAAVLFGKFSQGIVGVALACLGGMALIGLTDDWFKLRRNPKGLSVFRKLVLQVVVGYLAATATFLLMLSSDPTHASVLYLGPFGSLDLGGWYPTFLMLVIVLCANAVNITDGMDGLAAGSMTIAVFAFAIVCYVVGRSDFSAYLELPYMRSAAELTVVCAACLGACLGFLWFNSYPAQVFMGDSGSLALGGLLGLVAAVTKQEMMLLFVGAVFMVEVGCSFLQIFWFKVTRRRLFPIAPPHHIYQLRGMHEVKITHRFLIVQAVLSIVALATLKLR